MVGALRHLPGFDPQQIADAQLSKGEMGTPEEASVSSD